MNFQKGVNRWILHCFGMAPSMNKTDRTHRFMEEAVELAQACDCSKEEVLLLVDYVYGRPAGEIHQEIGGVMNTLAALSTAHGIDMLDAGEAEIDRCWLNTEKIRAKNAAKPDFSPLPGKSEDAA